MEQSVPTPVKLAFCIGAYRLCDFVHLGLKQLQRLAPDAPILVSDDAAPESGHIENLATVHGAVYRGSAKRRGHFGGDVQAFVNAIAFAEAVGADVAVKVSQRFIFRKPESIDALTKAFNDPNIAFATPGQPKMPSSFGGTTKTGFGSFTVLSDLIAVRVGCLSSSDLLHKYRTRLMTEKVAWGSFIECLCDDLHQNVFPGRTVKIEELTNHQDLEDPIYLRRYQNTPQQYSMLAGTHGLGGNYMLHEWGAAEGKGYLCKPLCV